MPVAALINGHSAATIATGGNTAVAVPVAALINGHMMCTRSMKTTGSVAVPVAALINGHEVIVFDVDGLPPSQCPLRP